MGVGGIIRNTPNLRISAIYTLFCHQLLSASASFVIHNIKHVNRKKFLKKNPNVGITCNYQRTNTRRCPFVSYSPSHVSLNMVFAPPGSGYCTPEEEEDPMSPLYDPIMEYPGTMRPARTRENVPYEDLPIDEDGPPPVPWPHFQELPYHHVWGSPHDEAPVSINQYIEDMGRWATLEDEAETIRQTRRAMRDAKAAAQQQAKDDIVVLDDDLEDDEEDDVEELAVASLTSSNASAGNTKTAAPAQLEDDGDFLLEELGLDIDANEQENRSTNNSSNEDEGDDDFDFDLGLDDNDDTDESVDELQEDLVENADGVAVEGTGHKGKIDPIVPDDYEKSNDNVDGFEFQADELFEDDDDYDDELEFDDDESNH